MTCSKIRLKDHLKQLVLDTGNKPFRVPYNKERNLLSRLNNTAHKSFQLMCQQPSLPWTPTHKEHLRLECLYTESVAKIVINLATERFRNSLLRFRNNNFLARWNAAPNPSRKNVPQTRTLPAQSSSKKHEVVNLSYTAQQLHSAQCASIFKMVQFFHTTYLWVSYDSQNKTL